MSNPRIIVRRNAAIGDCVAASVVADKLKERGYECDWQCNNMIVPVLRHSPSISTLSPPNGFAHVNLDGAYETYPFRRTSHFSDMFLARANSSLMPLGIDLGKAVNARPRLVLPAQTTAIAKAKFNDYIHPWIFICPASFWYRARSVPNWIWEEVARHTIGTKFWIGGSPAPTGIIDLSPKSISDVTAWISAADLVISVDTGPLHIAAALGKKVLALGQSSSPELHLSDQRDFQTIWPEGDLACLNCQENVCKLNPFIPPCQTFDPAKIGRRANEMVRENRVSCVIPTFAASPEQLSRCLQNVTPQVDEVVLTCAADGVVPNIPLRSARVVKSWRSSLGFGKNVNFGFRHTSGDWVLLLNDDCYLSPDCVKQLRDLCAPDVGMIAHLLRYPNGKIYFAGRKREPGQRGFPHINHNDFTPDIIEPAEMEAVSATSVLINRKAFYEIGGFDERFMMYAEDDDISMRMRKAGYKLLYHPTALGVHEGSATAKKTGDINRWIGESAKLMESLWGWYWDTNRNRVPGVFR